MLYVRSFLALRTFIGVLGVALPVLVVCGDRLIFDGHPYGRTWPRGSISAYYYSGMRDVFVGTVAATGVFFIADKVWERNRENLLSWTAGGAACAIALFPTKPPQPVGDDPSVVLSPLQNKFGVMWISYFHYAASALFLVSLVWISWEFGNREGWPAQADCDVAVAEVLALVPPGLRDSDDRGACLGGRREHRSRDLALDADRRGSLRVRVRRLLVLERVRDPHPLGHPTPDARGD